MNELRTKRKREVIKLPFLDAGALISLGDGFFGTSESQHAFGNAFGV